MKDKLLNKHTAVEGSFSYLLAVLMYLIVSLIFGLILNAVGDNVTGSAVVNLFFSLVVQVCFVAVSFIPSKVFHSRITYAPKKTPVSKCIIAVIIGVLCYAGFAGIATCFNEALFIGGYPQTESLGVVPLVLTAISAIAFAPIGEEFLFRGSILSSLTVIGNKKLREGTRHFIAVIGCGLLFALMHMNPLQTVYQFLLGCALAYATIKLGNIVPAIIIHAVSNIIGVVFCVPAVDGAVMSWVASSFVMGWSTAVFVVVSVLLAVGAAFVIWLLCKKFAEKPQPKGEIICDLSGAEHGGTAASYMIIIPTLLICLAIWTVTLVKGLMGAL